MQIYQKTIFILSKAFHFVFTKTLDLKVSLIWFIDKKKEKKKQLPTILIGTGFNVKPTSKSSLPSVKKEVWFLLQFEGACFLN